MEDKGRYAGRGQAKERVLREKDARRGGPGATPQADKSINESAAVLLIDEFCCGTMAEGS